MNTKQKLAKQRIEILFTQANKSKDQELSDKYIKLARKIAMKAQIPIPRQFKRQFCKHCYTYFRPAKNLRIRLQGKGKGRRVVYSCLSCKKHMRFMYKVKNSKFKAHS